MSAGSAFELSQRRLYKQSQQRPCDHTEKSKQLPACIGGKQRKQRMQTKTVTDQARLDDLPQDECGKIKDQKTEAEIVIML